MNIKIESLEKSEGFAIFMAFCLLAFISTGSVNAHSGRTDSSGGHNCNVGACAGTYHYHNGGIVVPPVYLYSTPSPKVIYVTPTATPKLTSTNTPNPTSTPAPTVEPTSTPSPFIKHVDEESSRKNMGFWEFILSLLSL